MSLTSSRFRRGCAGTTARSTGASPSAARNRATSARRRTAGERQLAGLPLGEPARRAAELAAEGRDQRLVERRPRRIGDQAGDRSATHGTASAR